MRPWPGKSGAEELTGILNHRFEPLIDLVHAYGGTITRFGGDAIGLLFPYTKRSRASAAQRAVACAWEMQRKITGHTVHTDGGDYELAMKVGISCGQVTWAIVGDPSSPLEYIVAGEAVRRCVAAEHAGSKGDVVVDVRIAPDLQGRAELVELRNGFHRVKSISPLRPSRRRQTRSINLTSNVQDVASRFLHPRIAEQLIGGMPGFVNEHRMSSPPRLAWASRGWRLRSLRSPSGAASMYRPACARRMRPRRATRLGIRSGAACSVLIHHSPTGNKSFACARR